MKRLTSWFPILLVVLTACVQRRPAQPYPQQAYLPPQGYPAQPYPPQYYPQGYYPPQQPYPQQPYPQQPYPQQPYPPAPRPAPPPPNLGVPSTDQRVVSMCRKAEDEWQKACGCPVRIVVDMSTTSVIPPDSFFTASDFESQGAHFCDDIVTSPGRPISSFCKGRERDMCSISAIRFIRVPASGTYDCTFNNGVAAPQSNGQGFSTIENCYKRVTRW